MQELNLIEVETVGGGVPLAVIYGGAVAVLAYIKVLETAAELGAGIGRGLYDATH